MNRAMLATLFAVGLMAVAWVGLGFVGSNGLALLMTVVIGMSFRWAHGRSGAFAV